MATLATDNRYSRNKYAKTKYGISAAFKSLAWGLEIDWGGDGSFSGANESSRLVGFSGFRGRKNMLKPAGDGFEIMETGQYTFVLDNYDGRYTAWNASSPLYPNVAPGVDIKFRVRDRNSVQIYTVFYGIIQDISQQIGDGSNPRVQITASDAWSYLRNNKARVTVQAAIEVSAAVNKVLNAVGWPGRWGSSLDVTSDTLSYYWASGQNEAGLEIQNLGYAGAHTFFISDTGMAKLVSRADIPTAMLSISEVDVLKNVAPLQPWINSRNVTRLTVYPLTKAATGVIWKLSGTAPSVLPGASNALSFTANYTYNNQPCSALNVLQPVASTDWFCNTQPDGSGTDKTANCTFVIIDNGDNAYCIVTNNTAGVVYLLSGAQIKGDAIYVQNTVEATYPGDVTTIASPREFKQDLPWLQDVNIGVSLATVLGPFFAAGRPVVVVQIAGRPDIQFIPDLMDAVTASLPSLGLGSNSYRVGGMAHQSQDEGCQDILTTLYLEPYPTVSNAGVYDTSVYDTGVYGW